MAMSGTIYGSTSRNASKFDFYLEWSVINSTADRVANNRSQVQVRVKISTTSTVNTFDTVVARSHWAKIDGVADNWSARIDCSPWPANPLVVRTYTRYVTHNSNGTKSLNISAFVDGHASTWGPDNCNASATVTLDTIIKDLDADAETAWVDIVARNASGVSGIGADAQTGSPSITGYAGSTNATVTPLTAGALAMANSPVRIGDAALGSPPSVRVTSLGSQDKAARSSFPCQIPVGAKPGDTMVFALHYQSSIAAAIAYQPFGGWAERARTEVNSNNTLWVWERQVQVGEPGLEIEATTSAPVIGVASIIVLQSANFNASSAVSIETATVTISATSQGTPAASNYFIVSNDDASNFGVGDKIQLYNTSDVLKESTVFTVTKMESAFGFTNLFFTPNAAVTPTSTDKVKSKGIPVGAVSPNRDECLFLEVGAYYEDSASTTPVTSSEVSGWETWVDHPHYAGVASRRHGAVYMATTVMPSIDSGFETSVDNWTATSGTIAQAMNKAKQGRGSCLLTMNGGAAPGFQTRHRFTVQSGQTYHVSGWVNADQSLNDGVGIAIHWYDSAGTFISTSITYRAPRVDTWEFWEDDFEAPGDATRATLGVLCAGTPASGSILYADEIRMTPFGPWRRTLSATSSSLSVTLAYESLETLVQRIADFNFQIDWDSDGDWDDDAEDVTNRVMRRSAVRIKYGRDQDRALSPSAPGEAGFELNNISRDYYPDNKFSPLHGLIAPARPVRIRAFTGNQEYILYRGLTDGFDLDPQRDARSVGVSCVDGLITLQDITVSSKLYPSIRVGDAIHAVLDLAGWSKDLRDIDPGATTLRWWQAEGTAAEVVDSLAANEGPPSLISISPEGKFIFRDRHHRLLRRQSTASQATFRDSGTEPLFSPPLTYDHGWRDIVNHVEADVPERRVSGALSVVWSGGASVYTVPAGRPLEIAAVSENSFVDPVAPEVTVDYRVISGSPIIEVTKILANEVTLKLSTASGAATISNLQVRAYAVEEEEATKRVVLSDAASIEQYLRRASPSLETTHSTYEDVKAIAQIMLAHRAERLPIVTFTLKRRDDNVIRYVHMLSRDISDRVTIVDAETGLDNDFYIERIEHDIADLGHFHTTEFGCEKVPNQVVGAMQLDIGVLDTNVLGREGMDDPTTVFILDSHNVLDLNLLGN